MTNTATEQLSPLSLLRERVLRFPARHEEVKRIDNLRQVEQLVAGLRDQVRKVRGQREHLIVVFGDADTSSSDRALQSVEVKAAALERVLTSGPQAWETDAQQAVRELRRAVEAASAAVQREWAAEVGHVTNKYERLANALRHAGLAGGSTIASALDRVRKLSEPPSSRSAAARAAEDIGSVPPTIARLGISGAIGEFLVAALEGNGTARALRDPSVQEFLDENKLWDMLRVSIR